MCVARRPLQVQKYSYRCHKVSVLPSAGRTEGKKDMCRCLSCISEIAPDTFISHNQYLCIFFLFSPPSTHPCLHVYTDILFNFFKPPFCTLYGIPSPHIWSKSVGSNTFTLWLWVKYDFNYHENVLYYQWEDKNRLRKLWDALTDDNGQVSMRAAVLEKMIDIHRFDKSSEERRWYSM